MILNNYRKRLRMTVGSSAAPYGYTLAIWTSGASLMNVRGVPDMLATLAFMAGAVLGFALVGALAFGGITRHFDRSPGEASLVWGALHFFSVGAAIGAATLVAHFVQSFAAWPLGGFLATATYLLVAGAESTAAYEWERREQK